MDTADTIFGLARFDIFHFDLELISMTTTTPTMSVTMAHFSRSGTTSAALTLPTGALRGERKHPPDNEKS